MSEDSKGKSTILYKASNINLDLTETALSFNWNNLRTLSIEKPNTLILGLSAYGKNELGLGSLLDDGDFVPSSRMSGIIGWKNKTISKDFREEQALKDDLEKTMSDPEVVKYNNLLNFQKTLDTQLKASSLADFRKAKIKSIIKKIITKKRGDFVKIKASVDSLAGEFNKAHDSEFEKLAKEFSSQIETDFNSFQKPSAEVQAKLDAIEYLNAAYFDARQKSKDFNLIIFVNGGTESKQFYLYKETDVTDLNKRFKKKTYRSDFIDLTVNVDLSARWIFGLSFGYQRSNTFDSLTKKDFTIKTTTVLGDQQMTTEKKYESYTGDFQYYDRLNIKTDAIYFARINGSNGKKNEYRIAWNVLYSRWYLSQETEIANKVINLGTGLNFFKKDGKFVGGFYLEETDAFNGNDTPDSDFWKRLSFGIVGKYTFQTILDRKWSN